MSAADTINNAWAYIAGQCTAFVASVISWVPAGWGNAAQWWTNAQQQGYATGQTPQVGAVAVWSGALPGSDDDGHVAEVTSVGPSSFTVSEENYEGGPGVVDSRTVPDNSSDLLGFIYGPPGTPATLTSASGVPGIAQPAVSGAQDLLGGAAGTVEQGVQAAVNATLDNWVQTAFSGLSGAASAAGQDVGTAINRNVIALGTAAAVTAVVMWRVKADA